MKNNWFKFFAALIFLSCVFSCKKEYKMPQEIENIEVAIKVNRFDQEFININQEKLSALKNKYPYLFSQKLKDTFWLKKSKDTLQVELANEVNKVFSETNELEAELTNLYKYLKFYYPQIQEPTIVSLISEVDYKNRVILTKELLLLSLDCYLGGDHYFYEDIQKYIRTDFQKSLLITDVAMEYAKKIVPRADGRDFLSQMILYGKRLYLLHKLLPKKQFYQLIAYTPNEWQWATENESFIWRYFIEKDMVFSTDKTLLSRFIYPAPFSKFYLEIDSQSTDRIAQYIGFKIVLAFMEHNNVSLQQLMEMDSKTLFETSKYKPKK